MYSSFKLPKFSGETSDSPIYAQAMRDLSVALRNLGDLPRAQTYLEKALEAAPDDENIIKAFLTGLRAAKDYPKLLEFAKRLLLLDPLDAYYYVLMGDALVALGQLDAAHNWYTKAIEMATEESSKQPARRRLLRLDARRLIEPLLALTIVPRNSRD